MTNNGDIINKMMRAGNRHEKEYKVTVNKPVTSEFIGKMGMGVPILLGGTLRGLFENPPQAFFDPFQRPAHLREHRRHFPTRRILAEYGLLSFQIFCLHLASPE